MLEICKVVCNGWETLGRFAGMWGFMVRLLWGSCCRMFGYEVELVGLMVP